MALRLGASRTALSSLGTAFITRYFRRSGIDRFNATLAKYDAIRAAAGIRAMSELAGNTEEKYKTLMTSKIETHLIQLVNKQASLVERLNQKSDELSPDAMATISKEISDLDELTTPFLELKRIRQELCELDKAYQESCQESNRDAELEEMLTEERDDARERLNRQERAVIRALIPPDPTDAASAILEIRPGTGGDEASLFAGDMYRMFQRYSEEKQWKFEILSSNGDLPRSIKEAVVSITGKGVFGNLKYESGVHRVQRVPETEKQGRVHTSTITVAILPQATEVDITIRESDLRIDLYRASGKGGQHVNTTDSAVRITHIPTGTVVAMQDERSQHKNKAKALKVLRARVYEQERQRTELERRSARNQQIGSGGRSEKIRTYNFPQNRITDHRYNYTMHGVEAFLTGETTQMLIDTLKLREEIENISSL
ncbi:hypothetical protein BDF19DRAFT_434796 [Syncephalis fuscata]|nr:hypothetical protein BDF19DRAFT_434796 [Syncephalis fuscata]